MQDIVEGTKMSKRPMKVEVAILRELAYRRKVAKLTGRDLEHLQPLQAKIQAQSPSPSVDTRTKPAKDSSLSLAAQPPKQDGEMKMVSYLEDDESFCKICQVPCSSPSNYQQHLRGQKHKARELGLKHGREVAKKRIWCSLCNIWCIDQDAYGQHLAGQKHQKVEFAKKNGGQPQKYCELCGVWCTDDSSFNMHLAGRSHVLKLHSIGSRKRARE